MQQISAAETQQKRDTIQFQQPLYEFSSHHGCTTFATTTDVARRWQVDRATARAVISAADINASTIHATSRYAWRDIFTRIEGWDDSIVMSIDPTECLYRAEELADLFDLTPQTIRNYGRSGRLHQVRLSARVLRYAHAVTPGEAKSYDPGKR